LDAIVRKAERLRDVFGKAIVEWVEADQRWSTYWSRRDPTGIRREDLEEDKRLHLIAQRKRQRKRSAARTFLEYKEQNLQHLIDHGFFK